MQAKQLVVLSVAALLLFYVVVDPAGAACLTRQVLALLADGADGLFEFIQQFFAGL